MMRYRNLGQTGLSVSEVGFGAWGIGGWSPGQLSYGPTDDAQSMAALEAAIAQGITFFDTSPLYGLGHSESLIGEALSGLRHKVVIATKAGYVAYDQDANYSPEAIRRSLEDSLKRLRTDYVDLLQLHSPDMHDLSGISMAIDELRNIQIEGMIRSFGISVKNPIDAVQCIKDFAVPVIQVNFNMLDLRVLDLGIDRLATEFGTGIISRTPLCFGFLTNKFKHDSSFDAYDHRSRWPQEQLNRWIDGASRLLAVADSDYPFPATRQALRFCLSYDFIATVIPGILSPEEAIANASSSDAPHMSKQILQSIRNEYMAVDLYQG